MRFAGQTQSYEESIRKKARSTSCGLTFGVLRVLQRAKRSWRARSRAHRATGGGRSHPL